ncbi:hypothetical protein QOT17_011176 [Balamuthia mandrillaris]
METCNSESINDFDNVTGVLGQWKEDLVKTKMLSMRNQSEGKGWLTLPHKSTELIDSLEREQVLHQWVDLAMKERLRLGTLNSNQAKIPKCFVKKDKLNQFLEEVFKLVVEKYGHLNTTIVKIPSPREGTSVVPKGKIDWDSVSANSIKEQTVKWRCCLIVFAVELIESLNKEINNHMGEKGSANSTKGGLTLGSQRSYMEVVGSAPQRTWTKDTVTDPNYWSTVKPKYGFASPYSKVGAVEGRSIVVSGKDLKKEKVCKRIFELGLKHVGVWKVGEKNGTQHWGVTLEMAQAAEDIIVERARLYAFTR